MKRLLILVVLFAGILHSHALVISEIMSNPTGVDDGREWIELYNDTLDPVDISGLSISIKNGNAIATTPVQGGTIVDPHSYAIIGSVISSQTKFLQDYPAYTGVLLKSSIGLVNTGVTSIDIKIGGVSVDAIPSYTAAKEGFTVSLIGGSFVVGNPTPGADNQLSTPQNTGTSNPTSTTTDNQTTVVQMSPPSADIVLYMPFEKTVVAGAETYFSTYGMTRGGKNIEGLTYTWAFGDGGRAQGSTTVYTYAYPGRYIVQVEGINGYVAGLGRMSVRVVSPDVRITTIGTGKYGTYVDIANPNEYSLDVSQWRLVINDQGFPFPKNTMIAGNTTTRFSGIAMGFASTTIASSTIVKILFPSLEEVTRFTSDAGIQATGTTLGISTSTNLQPARLNVRTILATQSIRKATTTPHVATTAQVSSDNKDRRIIRWITSFFRK